MSTNDDDPTEISLEQPSSHLSEGSIIGRKIGKYTVLQKIARGGTATVYRAHDTVLNREVAFKILHDHMEQKQEVVERFQNEARVVASLRHSNILNIFDFFEHEGRAVLVTEFMPGITLSELIKSYRKIPEPIVLMIAHELLAGLGAAHQKGIIHRDIKPANILIHPEIGIKISDFGLAKIVDADDGLTREGVFIGTPSFSSPEQIEGRPVDQRSDVFSLGLTLYMLATGRHAFKQKGDSTTTVWFKIVRGKFQALRELDPNISSGLEKILDRALQVDPQKRYPSAKEMGEDVRALLTRLKAYPYEDELKNYLRNPYGLKMAAASKRKISRRGLPLLFGGIALASALWLWQPWREEVQSPPHVAPAETEALPQELSKDPSEKSESNKSNEAAPSQVSSQPPTVAPSAQKPQVRAWPSGLTEEFFIPLSREVKVIAPPSERRFALRINFAEESDVLIARDEAFQSVVHSGRYKAGGFDWTDWREGFYFWKAGSQYGSVEIMNFEDFEEDLDRRSERIQSDIQSYDLQFNPWRQRLILSWESAGSAPRYEVLLARGENFSDVFKRQSTTQKTFPVEWNWQESQIFYWKVRFLDQFGSVVNDIPWREVKLRLVGRPSRFVLIYPRPFQEVQGDLNFFAGLPRDANLACRDFSNSDETSWQDLTSNEAVIFQKLNWQASSRLLCRVRSEDEQYFVIPIRN